jgi:ArsR family transcriptional regulator
MAIYDCLCDETRVRILNLLLRGSLCVGDFQEILRRPQVFVSKHLAYLRGRGMVQAERFGNWMIYSVPKERSRELEANLRCLHAAACGFPGGFEEAAGDAEADGVQRGGGAGGGAT